MQQLVKILLIIIAISLLFWVVSSMFMGGDSAMNKLIEEQDRVSAPDQPGEAPAETEQTTFKSEPEASEETSRMITTEPLTDDSGMQLTPPDMEDSDQNFGGIDHILTPEEREAMMEFAPEAGDNGMIGEPPEAGDTGNYSDGPGGADSLTGDTVMPGTSLEDSYDAGLQGEEPGDSDATFGSSPEDSQLR